MENVRGLLTWRHPGTGLRAISYVEEAFASAGYLPIVGLLNAADYGVPQHRIRCFIVGFRNEFARARFRWPVPSHANPAELRMDLERREKPWRTVREALGLQGQYGVVRYARHRVGKGQRHLDVDEPSPTVCGTRASELLSPLDRPSPTVRPNAARDAQDPGRASRRPMGELRAALGQDGSSLDRPSPTISSGGGATGGPEPLTNAKLRDRLHKDLAQARLLDRPSTTVSTTNQPSTAGHHIRQQAGAVRLQPEDCAKLQAFPDDFVFYGNRTDKFRQIGNGVPPIFGQAIVLSVHAALDPKKARRP